MHVGLILTDVRPVRPGLDCFEIDMRGNLEKRLHEDYERKLTVRPLALAQRDAPFVVDEDNLDFKSCLDELYDAVTSGLGDDLL